MTTTPAAPAVHAIVPAPKPIPDEVWQRFRGNQRYRERRFVESGGERRRLISLGHIIPAKKKGKK